MHVWITLPVTTLHKPKLQSPRWVYRLLRLTAYIQWKGTLHDRTTMRKNDETQPWSTLCISSASPFCPCSDLPPTQTVPWIHGRSWASGADPQWTAQTPAGEAEWLEMDASLQVETLWTSQCQTPRDNQVGNGEHLDNHLQSMQHNMSFTLLTIIINVRCPSYLADLVTFNTTYSQRCHLQPSTTRSAAVRRAQTQFGKRAFSHCGPDVWNSLPIALRNIDSYPAFRRALKSHLFSCAFTSSLLSHIFTDIVMHSRPCFL